MNLKGKHALVTGGGSGIGAAIAFALARAGADVTICGRRTEELEFTAERHDNIHWVTADVTDEASVGQLYERGAKGARTLSTSSSPMPAWRKARRPKKSPARCGAKSSTSTSPARSSRCKPALAGNAREEMGTHRLHRLDRGAERLSLCGALCRRQAWRRRTRARAWRPKPQRPASPSMPSARALPKRRCSTARSIASPQRSKLSEAEARKVLEAQQSAGALHPAARSRRRGAVAVRRRAAPPSPARPSRYPEARHGERARCPPRAREKRQQGAAAAVDQAACAPAG